MKHSSPAIRQESWTAFERRHGKSVRDAGIALAAIVGMDVANGNAYRPVQP